MDIVDTTVYCYCGAACKTHSNKDGTITHMCPNWQPVVGGGCTFKMDQKYVVFNDVQWQAKNTRRRTQQYPQAFLKQKMLDAQEYADNPIRMQKNIEELLKVARSIEKLLRKAVYDKAPPQFATPTYNNKPYQTPGKTHWQVYKSN